MQYKVLLMVLLMIVVGSTWAQTQTKQFRVNFNVDEHTLDKSDEVILNELLLLCKQATYAEIKLTAHTDIDADDQYNLALSKRRAQSVTTYLEANQLNTKNILVNWYGERKPEASNNNDEGKAMNRRVDILVSTYEINNTADLLKSISPEYTQTFTINPKQDNIIKGKNGTSITIPKDALVTKSGKPIDANAVQITLKEFLKPKDAAFNQLSTISNGKLLESGGMFSIEAAANGEPVSLKKGQAMQVQMPTINMRNNMQLFTEVKNAQGISEWKPTNVPFRPAVANGKDTPHINLNTAYLKSLLVNNERPEQTPQYEYALQPLPKKPAYIGNAPRYIEPTLKSEFSWWERTIYSTDKLKAQLEIITANYQKSFNLSQTNYLRKKVRYDLAMDKYQKDSVNFEKDNLANLRNWLAQQKVIHQQHIDYMEKDCWNKALNNLIWLSDKNLITQINFKDNFINDVNPLYNIHGNRYVHHIALSTISQLQELSLHQVAQKWTKGNKINLSKITGLNAYYVRAPNNFAATKMIEHEKLLAMLDKELMTLMVKRDKAKMYDAKSVNSIYATSLSGFGSYNCDRFSETPPNRMAKIRIPFTGVANVSFFVPSINSYIYAYQDQNGYYANLPKDMDIKVVFVSFSKATGPILDVRPIKLKKDTEFVLQPKNVTLAEMFKQLNNI